jgi:hypothetical protein
LPYEFGNVEVIRLMGVMIDLYCASYATPPVAVTLDTSPLVNRCG